VSKAFLDTTILVNLLLKRGEVRKRSQDALKRFDGVDFPVFAIKEFKAGALSNWVWLHNKLVATRSLAKTLDAIRAVMLFKKNLASTALEALADLGKQSKSTFADLESQYGKQADPDVVAADRLRSGAKTRVFLAWRARRSIGAATVPLPCYLESGPYEVDGLLSCKPVKCDADDCSMAPALKARPADLNALRDAVKAQPIKPENARRAKALKELIRNRPVDDSLCRSLGDAIFAFFAPNGSVILTTNIRDHGPLAQALGKKAEVP
jgi:hypothetical protein